MRNEFQIKQIAYGIPMEEIINEIKHTGRKYLVAYNFQFEKNVNEMLKKGNLRIIGNSKKYYEFLRNRAIELGIDVSTHPETLEELTS